MQVPRGAVLDCHCPCLQRSIAYWAWQLKVQAWQGQGQGGSWAKYMTCGWRSRAVAPGRCMHGIASTAQPAPGVWQGSQAELHAPSWTQMLDHAGPK